MKIKIIFVILASYPLITFAQINGEAKIYELFRWDKHSYSHATITINGHISTNTYGSIEYIDSSYEHKKIPFLYINEMFVFRKHDHEVLLSLSDSTPINLWLCIKSPVYAELSYCDTLTVSGKCKLADLNLQGSPPYVRIVITLLKKKYYKIKLKSTSIVCIYKTDTQRDVYKRRRVDAKEQRIQKGCWGPPLW